MTTVHTSGPIFDHSVHGLAARMCEEMEQELADEGERLVNAELPRVFRNETGFYQSHIRQEPEGAGIMVSDGGQIVYGPWLEGVGSRNSPKTRFPGYSTFRRMAQRLRGKARVQVEPIVNRWVDRMGG